MTDVKPGLYQHFKGNLYRVIGTGLHTETEEALVFYHPADDNTALFARPTAMFTEVVERDHYKGPRFRFVEA